ncbi:MAG: DNA gyrase inhibitor YacG [Gammaproteobacteria bacterium]
MTTVRCPNCRTDVVWSTDNAFRPFCSKRCRLIDLGEWFNETHRIPTDEPASGNDEFNQD